jgi:hypothetical protein
VLLVRPAAEGTPESTTPVSSCAVGDEHSRRRWRRVGFAAAGGVAACFALLVLFAGHARADTSITPAVISPAPAAPVITSASPALQDRAATLSRPTTPSDGPASAALTASLTQRASTTGGVLSSVWVNRLGLGAPVDSASVRVARQPAPTTGESRSRGSTIRVAEGLMAMTRPSPRAPFVAPREQSLAVGSRQTATGPAAAAVIIAATPAAAPLPLPPPSAPTVPWTPEGWDSFIITFAVLIASLMLGSVPTRSCRGVLSEQQPSTYLNLAVERPG